MLSGIRLAPHALGTCFSRLDSSPGPQAKDTLADTDTLTEHTPGASILVPNQASASWAALRQVTTWRGRLGAPETSLRVRTGGDAQISQNRLEAFGGVASVGSWTSPPPGNRLSFPQRTTSSSSVATAPLLPSKGPLQDTRFARPP